MVSSWESDAEVAIRAADAACEVIRRSCGRTLRQGRRRFRHRGRSRRGARDPGSSAGGAAGRRVVGEEYGADEEAGSRTWLVDPLCGTMNYAVRTRLVAVGIALRAGDDVTAAVPADPFSGEMCSLPELRPAHLPRVALSCRCADTA
ncbi:inositol monophosphatase family protein [Amycolatopsis sp. NPDC052450]|uniref:inositol monophosphatase family protein n=1 Tax=Amycolatopsis sp. NPDC052450 TaxID=3363937 RepID=UPI0037C79D77